MTMDKEIIVCLGLAQETVGGSGSGDLSNYYTKGEVNSRLATKENLFRYDSMPDADLYPGKIIQYTGETDSTYTNGYFYKSVEQEGVWTWVQTSCGPSGAPALSSDIVTNITVGGVTSGTTLPQGMTFDQYVTAVHVTYIAPSISMSSDKTLLNEIGVPVSQPIKVRATSSKGSVNITKTAVLFNNVEVATGTNPAGETVTYTYTTNISSNTTFTSSVTDGQQTRTSSLKFEFINPFYYGVSNSSTISSFTNMDKLLRKKQNNTITYASIQNQYVVYAYDSTYGNLSKIEDQNGFDNTQSWTKSTLTQTIDGVNYTFNVYVSNTPVTKTNFKYTFMF